MELKKIRTQIVKNAFKAALVAALLEVFAVSVLAIVMDMREYNVGETAYDSIERTVVTYIADSSQKETKTKKKENATDTNVPKEKQDKKTPDIPISVNFETLCAENPDVVAWIYSEGTSISYPIVQANNNEKYLRHLLDGKHNIAGTLFVDYRHESPFNEDLNTIVYGHNLKNGEMLGSILKYKSESYYTEHPTMWLFTPDTTYIMEVVGWIETDLDSPLYIFSPSPEDVRTLLNEAHKNTPYIELTEEMYSQKCVTLSTCAYDYEGARFLLVLRPHLHECAG